ncbi:uncharacterized protein LOC106646692 isoform X2 [Copidosoma floridanum]|uniref:uncharacterized protein LOC106646692 isoform X2 n=1 Tax=Copidosoma floridanum TaxID=29053 RepID=UPI0006C97DC6|nr:uncharacterized protein LOC106646692 isoform X2 [Copidosoma floridanum]
MYRNNNLPYMDPRKTPKRMIEPVDEWLQNEGFYRKHGPKDPTCLFRAIAEQVYHNQRSHLRVREECVEYIRDNKQLFQEKTMIPVGSYCDQMACVTEWGGENEILAMSLLYQKNVVIFDGHKLTKKVAIDNRRQENFLLCFMPPKQYETVYNQEHTAIAGFCQSIIYQILYKNVFKMSNVDATVHKMLHERNNYLRHDKFFLKGNLGNRNQLTVDLLNKLEESDDNEESLLLEKGITPFPYRVAKALDPNIYRNVDYDIWLEIRREMRRSGFTKFNSSELQVGAKCLVSIDFKDNDKTNNNFPIDQVNWDNFKEITKSNGLEALLYTGHIQEISKNHGPVVIFVEELGQKITVSYESLKPYPQRKPRSNYNNYNNTWALSPNKRSAINQNQKWKKPWNGGPNRRTKDQVPNDGNNEKNLNNSKSVAKNTVNKTEDTENQPRIPNENRVALKDYNIKDQVENLKNTLESTHISVESVEPRISDKKSKINVNNQQNEHSSQKQITTSINHEDNSSNQQNYQRADNNDTFYPPYAGSAFQPIPRFPADSEIVSYDATKTYEIKANEAPSDPANGRQFYNVGVKYYWSQNMWPNGTNGPSFNDNTFFFAHPAPDPNNYSFVVNGPVPCSDNIVQQANNYQHNNQHVRHNNRSSPPRHRDQDQNTNIPRPAGQRMNYHYRNPDFRNLTHNPNIDNRIRNDGKNNNPNEQPQQNGNKDMQRVNKSNGMAPRFKKNYEGGKYRNDHNPQYQYRQQQHQPDYDIRKRKQIDMQTMQNRCDMINDPAQQHQLLQPINAMLHQQQPNHLPQQQSTMIQSQSPPPLNGPYPYSMTYNQVPYVPLGPYPPEPETFSGPYYSPPPGYIQVPYLPASELPTSEQTVYQPVEFPAQYPPVFSQYIYPPPAAMYPTQPPPPDSCYPPFPGQPYFLPYASPLPPPGMQPPNLTSPPTLQSAQ